MIRPMPAATSLNANSDKAPGIVDANAQPILDRSEIYSGCYGRVSISFYAFNTNGNQALTLKNKGLCGILDMN